MMEIREIFSDIYLYKCSRSHFPFVSQIFYLKPLIFKGRKSINRGGGI